MDVLDAVIGLGPNLFYGTGLAACVMVFRNRKPKDRRQQVLFIDASREFKKGRNQNELLPEHVDRLYAWYKAYADSPGVAKVVSLDEIRSNDFNLNIPRYVEPVVAEETVTVEQAVANLKSSLDAAMSRKIVSRRCSRKRG